MNKNVLFICFIMITAVFLMLIRSFQKSKKKISIGVSVSVMNAARWERDVLSMKKRAKELGAGIETIVSETDPEHQFEECKNLIDRKIDVLILVPGSATKAAEIVKYAHGHKVKVISYDRVVLFEPVDLTVTFDAGKVGELQGKYLTDKVGKGNYVILTGDESDANSSLLLDGAMKYIEPRIRSGDIRILAQDSIPNWSAYEAEKVIQKIIKSHTGKIDAILAPNDTIASGCIKALAKEEETGEVAITGMDADLEAIRRILKGEQDITVFKDIRVLASTSVEQAVKLARKERPDSNTVLDNLSSVPVITLYIQPQLVTKETIDEVLIQNGYYKKEDVYQENQILFP